MRKDKSVALGLFAISVLYSIGCIQLKLGTLRKPGPGLFPSFIAVALLLSTAAHLYKVFMKQEETSERPEGAPAVNLRVWAGLSICVFAYPALLMFLDFMLSTLLTVFAMLLVLRFKTWPVCFLVALVTAIVCFVVFAMLLGVALPSGSIETFFYRLKG
jgi:putative tricarboxylic transport membrane protein